MVSSGQICLHPYCRSRQEIWQSKGCPTYHAVAEKQNAKKSTALRVPRQALKDLVIFGLRPLPTVSRVFTLGQDLSYNRRLVHASVEHVCRYSAALVSHMQTLQALPNAAKAVWL